MGKKGGKAVRDKGRRGGGFGGAGRGGGIGKKMKGGGGKFKGGCSTPSSSVCLAQLTLHSATFQEEEPEEEVDTSSSKVEVEVTSRRTSRTVPAREVSHPILSPPPAR
jgi:hypothetical protein